MYIEVACNFHVNCNMHVILYVLRFTASSFSIKSGIISLAAATSAFFFIFFSSQSSAFLFLVSEALLLSVLRFTASSFSTKSGIKLKSSMLFVFFSSSDLLSIYNYKIICESNSYKYTQLIN